MYKLVLVRHGQSTWNLENRFTGWTDVDLSDAGRRRGPRRPARRSRRRASSSTPSTRPSSSAPSAPPGPILDEMDRMYLPLVPDWRLNERHYGALQGLNKAETAAKFGDEQVKIWRRSYDVPPPPLERSDERFPGHDPRYAGLPPEQLPLTESLKETVARVLPFWHEVLAPADQGRQAAAASRRTATRCGRW